MLTAGNRREVGLVCALRSCIILTPAVIQRHSYLIHSNAGGVGLTLTRENQGSTPEAGALTQPSIYTGSIQVK
jgi:hypothetical protein